MAEAATIVGYCRNCNEECYRSIKPLMPGVDAVKPEFFRPVKNQSTPPADGPALCDTCRGGLNFRPAVSEKPKETKMQRHLSPEELLAADREERMQPKNTTTSEKNVLPVNTISVHNPNGMAELFKVGEGEEIIHISPSPTGILVVTTKRIIRVNI